jgi:hypothetical protein
MLAARLSVGFLIFIPAKLTGRSGTAAHYTTRWQTGTAGRVDMKVVAPRPGVS